MLGVEASIRCLQREHREGASNARRGEIRESFLKAVAPQSPCKERVGVGRLSFTSLSGCLLSTSWEPVIEPGSGEMVADRWTWPLPSWNLFLEF